MHTSLATPVARGLVFVAVAALAWGSGGVVAAVLYRETGLGPIATSFWRTVIGAGALAISHHLLRPAARVDEPARGARSWLIAVATGVGLAVYQTAYYIGVIAAGAGVATVLTLGSAPILIALGSRIAIRERLGRVGAIAVLVAPFGLLLVAGGAAGATVLGISACLLSAAGYAGVTVLHRALGGIDPAGMTLAGFAVASVCLAPVAMWEGLWPVRGSLGPTVALLGYLGVFCTAIAYRLFFASLGAVRATTVGVVTLIEPVAAIGLAVLLLGERITWAVATGSLILLGAVGLLARDEVAEPSRR